MMSILKGAVYVIAALFILFLLRGFAGFIVDLWPVLKVGILVGALALVLKYLGGLFTSKEGSD
jgi:hypothetical protein